MVPRFILVLIFFRILRTSASFNNVTSVGEVEDISRQEWLSKLFDHQAWKAQDFMNVSHVCGEHIGLYLKGLKRDISWAAKMNDASGRYNGQFFFGNDFWLGSSTLCWELGNRETNEIVPPFPVHFSMVKVKLELGGIAMPAKQLMIGFCLPSSCSSLDVKTLLATDAEKAAQKFPNTTLDILDVRPVPGDYDLLKDVKFYIVGGVAVGVAVIVVMATILELWVNSRDLADIDNELQTSPNNNNEIKNGENPTNGKQKRNMKQRKENNKARGLASRLLLSFSASSNGKKILEVDKLPEDSIKCVHGLRFLSVAWVILVHTYLQVFSVAENKTLRIITERFFIYQTISNATFSVDSFFFISGLLVTIVYFRTASPKTTISANITSSSTVPSNSKIFLDNVKKFFLLIFYRIIRLTPAYLFVLGMHEVVIRYIHNTSVFEPNFYDHVTCDNYWWRNALYINTWYPQKEICMLWSWYMSNDTQFYILAVFLLLIAVRSDTHLKLSGFLLLGFLFSSWITTFIVAWQYNYHARIEDPFALFDQLYDKPWMRVGPYLVGMITGWILFRIRGKCRMHWTVVTTGWIAAIGTLMSLVYGVGKDGIVVPLSAIYAALGHTAWGLALAWITFACCTGHGGPVDAILSFRGFLPFSRLTYCAYLVHPMLMCITCFQMDGPLHLHNGVVFVLFFGNVVVAFLFSFLISLGFEAPVVRLLKIIMGGRSKDD